MSPAQRNRILAVAAVGFGLRIIFTLLFPGPNYFEGLSASYLHVADNVIAGKGIVVSVNIAPLTDPPVISDEPFIDRPLGYLFLLLVPTALVSDPVAVQVFQALLAGLGVILLFLLARDLVSERAAWWAAVAYALWPLSARFETAILPDAVMSFFLLLSAWLFVMASRKPRPTTWYLATGIVCGLGMTMRPDVLFLPLVFVGIIALRKGGTRRPQGIVVLLSGVALVVGLHTVRNYDATGGKIVPLGLGNGISMWEGISQFGDMHGTVYGDERMTRLEGYTSWAYPDGVERDRRRFREALQIIADHPVWYVGMVLRRIPVLLTPDWIMTKRFAPSLSDFLDESPDRSFWDYLSSNPIPSILRVILILLQYAALILAVIAVGRGWKFQLWLPVLIVLYYIIIHIPTNTEARYFYPVLPLLLLLSAHGWDLLTRNVHARQHHNSGL